MRMPMGYDTPAREAGASLSGGQRQRIAIARAIVNDPSILFLDEATSHLDVLTEQEIDDHLSTRGGTRIVISHRLQTIRNADILILEQGRIIERGSHDELVAMNGKYATLNRSMAEAESISMAVV